MRRLFTALLVRCLAVFAAAESVPPERPRARPPSELTGWADWERGEELLKRIQVPPAPPLKPEEAMKTFRLAPGYRLELVAAEPMVQNPIFFEFDPEGRIWVVEYQGYMRDLQGHGESAPICRVVVLEDADEDGRAEKSIVFLDGLVMPRSLSFVKDGVLVAEPPKLWYCRDTDGDLRCDQRVQVGTYGIAGNPQHTANGLRYGIDNWLHSSDSPKRHRFLDGRLIEEPTVHRGQFGVTFDDLGRYLTCYESSALHADLIPAEHLLRNANFFKGYLRGGNRDSFGVNVNVAREAQEVFPVRVTPQITLGALELRDDGRLRTYTVVAGSCFYNGHQFPEDAYSNVFVPEAGGHLIGRLRLSGDIELKASRFYPAEEEFLASTDERFRPVNARVGPEGALYIADMYRGIIEHVIFLAPWLEKQIKQRKLEEGLDMGRLYRVVYEGKPIDRKRPRLSSAKSAELANHLNHPNGWWRLTAQRLLVERRDPAAVPILRQMALHGPTPLGRLHALWTLDGMAGLDAKTAFAAADDNKDERVRATAVRLCERFAGRWNDPAGPDSAQGPANNGAPDKEPLAPEKVEAVFLGKLEQLSEDPSRLVRLHVTLTLGALHGERAEQLMAKLIENNEHHLFRVAAMTGLLGRELEFLLRLIKTPEWKTPTEHRRQMIFLLSQAIVDESEAGRLGRLFDSLASAATRLPWHRDAILDGMLAAVPRDLANVRPIQLVSEPAALIALTRSEDESLRQRAFRLHSVFTWPGAARSAPELAGIQPLSPEHQRLIALGKEQFLTACAACHQPHGGGLPNVAPPLGGSQWVTGPAERLVRIVLHGLYGPVEVGGERWNLHMPGFGAAFDDEKIAGILSYVRRAWGNVADPVEVDFVAKVRRGTESRTMAWNAAELTDAIEVPADDPSRIIRPDEQGELTLPARLATTYGRELAYRPSLDILAPWRREQDIAEWRVEVPRGGAFEVRVTLAADDASAGDRFAIECETSNTTGVVQSSGGYDRFREYECGKIVLRAGSNRIVMRPEGALKRELADVRALRLVPVGQE
jgi:mono/diheme cytochrome c family protein/glucose/arabinose dehydrogenase